MCYFLRRKWLLRHVIEGKIEGTRRRAIRSKQLVEELKGKRRHWNVKEEGLDCTKLCYFLSTSEDSSEDSELNIKFIKPAAEDRIFLHYVDMYLPDYTVLHLRTQQSQ
jgi:hypothetical protein